MSKVQHSGTRISAGGEDNQSWRTQPEFIEAVERCFHAKMDFDLAATAENTVVRKRFFTREQDSLSQSWKGIGKNLWLNPPFDNIGRYPQKPSGKYFAQKCWEEAKHLDPDQRIFLLARGAVGTDWYGEWVHGSAMVYALNPRLRFVDAKDDYNSELVLAIFHPRRRPSGFFFWTWDDPDSGPRKA
jgi:hypothetical protein